MTARFQFRGYGHSTGKTTFTSTGEIDDCVSIYKVFVFSDKFLLNWLMQNLQFTKTRINLNPTHVLFCNYGYGAIAACGSITSIPNIIGFINISFPSAIINHGGAFWKQKSLDYLKKLPTAAEESGKSMHKLFIHGAKDYFKNFMHYYESVSEPKTFVKIESIEDDVVSSS